MAQRWVVAQQAGVWAAVVESKRLLRAVCMEAVVAAHNGPVMQWVGHGAVCYRGHGVPAHHPPPGCHVHVCCSGHPAPGALSVCASALPACQWCATILVVRPMLVHTSITRITCCCCCIPLPAAGVLTLPCGGGVPRQPRVQAAYHAGSRAAGDIKAAHSAGKWPPTYLLTSPLRALWREGQVVRRAGGMMLTCPPASWDQEAGGQELSQRQA